MRAAIKVNFIGVLTALLAIGFSSYGSYGNEKSGREKSIANIKELPNRYKEVKHIAWQKMTDYSKRKTNDPMPIRLLVSPNAKDCSKSAIPIIRAMENIYQNTLRPKSLTIIFADEDRDGKWLRERTGELLEDKFRSYQGTKEINPETVNDKGDGVLWSTNPCRDSGKLSKAEETEISHGFAHVIQTRQFISSENYWGRWGEVPRWILEGCATFNHNYWTNGKTYSTYLRSSENLYELWKLKPKFFNRFLKYDNSFQPLWTYTDQWPNQRAYDVGSYVCEMLVALRGPESIMNIYSEYLATEDFNMAFKNIYGMTWTEARPIFSKAIYDLIQWNSKYFEFPKN